MKKATDTATLDSPLALSRGAGLKNRLVKSAMSEQMGDQHNQPDEGLARLYRAWASGGTGLLITGNVMIDRTALGEPRNVVLDEHSDLNPFRRWARAG